MCATAHPRSRGENREWIRHTAEGRGSSPLTRGKRGASRSLDLGTGLIPAHAGKTFAVTESDYRERAHPRSRGENGGSRRSCFRYHGSSPLTRGKLRPVAGRGGRRGLIPAHAGKTQITAAGSRQSKAHPRSRGENRWLTPRPTTPAGSSPLTRGKLKVVAQVAPVIGLIPAHAGKTITRADARPWPRAHPRSRGENRATGPPARTARGSSPLTRGKPQVGHLA